MPLRFPALLTQILTILLSLSASTPAAAPPAKDGVGTIKGKVVDSKGESVGEHAPIHLQHPRSANEPPKPPATFTDANGEFTLENVPVGTYEIETFAPGHRPARVTVRVKKDEVAAIEIELPDAPAAKNKPAAKEPAKPALGKITGIVLNARGKSVGNGAEIRIHAPKKGEGYGLADTSTQEDGTFELNDVPVGSYEMLAMYMNKEVRARVQVKKDATATVKFKFLDIKD